MSWKDLIFANPDGGKKKEKEAAPVDAQKSFQSKFPSSSPIIEPYVEKEAPVIPTQTIGTITPDNPACSPHLDKIMAMYEKGFEGLNLDGYDFYEYYKMVIEGGLTNPTVYTMAFSMGKTMGITKESLLAQSTHYITEIKKVHQNYVNSGNGKRQETITSKTTEETQLKTELIGIDAEIDRLVTLKAQKEAALREIDSKYAPQVTEIECKLMANDMAMERIVGSIEKVVEGINNNIN